MTIFRTWLGVILFGVVVGFAQENVDPLVNQAEGDLLKIVRVQVEFIEVPHETMTELLAEPRKSANDTPLRAKLQDLVKEGKAKIIETQMVSARSGQKASTQSLHEYIYPTEYEATKPPHIEDSSDKKVEENLQLPTSLVPLAYETRNVGSSLEIEPTIGEDSNIIDLRLLPHLVYHTGNNIWMELKHRENTYRAQMPNFYTLSTDTSMTLINGQTMLMSSNSPKDDKGEVDMTKKILIFVRADVLTVGK